MIVRYKRAHPPFEEWVYNGADIDHSKVIWAREMSPSENAELLGRFSRRCAWLLEGDEIPPRLSPYKDLAKNPLPQDATCNRKGET